MGESQGIVCQLLGNGGQVSQLQIGFSRALSLCRHRALNSSSLLVSFIQIPWNLKRRWQGRLRELVQAWAGVELEETDMYGMREYTTGARLLTHVDREATHAASLIVNIAQENVSKPWTVEVR